MSPEFQTRLVNRNRSCASTCLPRATNLLLVKASTLHPRMVSTCWLSQDLSQVTAGAVWSLPANHTNSFSARWCVSKSPIIFSFDNPSCTEVAAPDLFTMVAGEEEEIKWAPSTLCSSIGVECRSIRKTIRQRQRFSL